MALEHFILRRRTVRKGGLTFVCRSPTVATIHLVLGYYASEIVTARRECDDGIEVSELVMASATALGRLAEPRVRQVLETCVEGDLEAADPDTLGLLARTCAALLDIEFAVRHMEMPPIGESPVPSAAADDDAVSPQSIAVACIARDYGQSPSEVMEWPYGALCEALDAYEAMRPEKPPENGQDLSKLRGFGVADARRSN